MLNRIAILTIRNLAKNQRYFNYLSTLTCNKWPQHIAVLYNNTNYNQNRLCSRTTPPEHVVDSTLDHATYERVCMLTLEGLNDYFEQLLESVENIPGSDLSYSDGVLTINLGNDNGTYVINRQSPNRQIWLSSPTSGPKRYDFVGDASGTSGKWVYRHTGESLHELLLQELQQIFDSQKLEFEDLPYGK